MCEFKTFEGIFDRVKPFLSTLTDLRLTIPTNPPPLPTMHRMEDQLKILNNELRSLRTAKDNKIEALMLTFVHLALDEEQTAKQSKEWEALDDILASDDLEYWGSLRAVLFLVAGCGLTPERFKKLSQSKRVSFRLHTGLS